MRTIAVTNKCGDFEKNFILSAVEKDDKVLFFENDKELLESDVADKVDIIFGEPDLSTIQKMKKLRMIQMSWAGANKYTGNRDMFENISLLTASGAYGEVISEYIIAGILTLYRNIFIYKETMSAGKWDRILHEDTLEGKRVLILGIGNIGSLTAKKMKVFGTTVVGMSRTKKSKESVRVDEKNKSMGAICTNKTATEYFDELYTIDELDEQLKIADVVVIALPGTKDTANMFDERRFSLMKPTATLVNIGRGFIVNTDALTNALKNGVIKDAVIDVMDPEPLPAEHPLRQLDNLVLTPHISGLGWSSNIYTRKRILEILSENLKRDITGEPFINLVDFDYGY